jgi:type II secretory pathway pseudopilin PulG
MIRGTRRLAARLAPATGEAGLTLIELIVAFSLMLILSVMALPVARVKVQREKERRLREALHEMRQAIDRHKDMADEGKLGQLDPDNHGYPESLEALVEGVEMGEQGDGLPTVARGTGLQPSRAMERGSNNMRGFGSSTRQRTGFGARRGSSGDGAFSDRNDPFRRDDPLARDDDAPETVRFLRSIPVDSMTGRREWGMLSVSDNPESRSWGGRNVFDVFSLSNAIALDGTRYSEW